MRTLLLLTFSIYFFGCSSQLTETEQKLQGKWQQYEVQTLLGGTSYFIEFSGTDFEMKTENFSDAGPRFTWETYSKGEYYVKDKYIFFNSSYIRSEDKGLIFSLKKGSFKDSARYVISNDTLKIDFTTGVLDSVWKNFYAGILIKQK